LKAIGEYPEGQFFEGYARLISRQKRGGISFWLVRFKERDVKIILEEGKTANYKIVKQLKPGSLFYFKGLKSQTKDSNKEPIIRAKEVQVLTCYQGELFFRYQNKRYENRTLELLQESQLFEFYKIISLIPFAVRNFLLNHGYHEFNTGILQKVFEGGLAEPYSTISQIRQNTYYLSMTSELKLTRLLIAGFEKVFEVTQSFRNGGINSLSARECTLLEAQAVGDNYQSLCNLLESLIRTVVLRIKPTGELLYKNEGEDYLVNYKNPFKWLTFREAFQNLLGCLDDDPNLEWLVKKYPGLFKQNMPQATWVNKSIKKLIAPQLIEPTFLYKLPSELSPLVKTNTSPSLSEKAVLIAHKINIADIHSGENEMLKVKNAMELQSLHTGKPVNIEYLDILELGLPDFAVLGLSLNRLYMLFLGELPYNIHETLLFPIIK